MAKFWGFLVVAFGVIFGTVYLLDEKPKDDSANVEKMEQRQDEMYRAWKHAKAGEMIDLNLNLDVGDEKEKVNVYLFTGRDKKFLAAISKFGDSDKVYSFSVHPILSSLVRPPYADAKIIAERNGKEVKINSWKLVHTKEKPLFLPVEQGNQKN